MLRSLKMVGKKKNILVIAGVSISLINTAYSQSIIDVRFEA